jgi:hypothetical protein
LGCFLNIGRSFLAAYPIQLGGPDQERGGRALEPPFPPGLDIPAVLDNLRTPIYARGRYRTGEAT